MEEIIAFNNKSVGKDKIYRTTQFACKLLAWSIKSLDKDGEVVLKIKKLEAHAGLGRKFLRLGRSLNSVQSAQRSINLLDPVLRITLTTFYINQGVYLLLDHYLWMGKVGLLDVDKKWEFTSARLFHFSICLGIIRDLYSLHQTLITLTNKGKRLSIDIRLLIRICKTNPAATLDLVRNLFDLPLPASKLGFIPTHDGVLGVCGLVSSLIGAYQLARPNMKPKP